MSSPSGVVGKKMSAARRMPSRMGIMSSERWGEGVGWGHGWLLARWGSLIHDTIAGGWVGGCPHPGTLPPGGRGERCCLRGWVV